MNIATANRKDKKNPQYIQKKYDQIICKQMTNMESRNDPTQVTKNFLSPRGLSQDNRNKFWGI